MVRMSWSEYSSDTILIMVLDVLVAPQYCFSKHIYFLIFNVFGNIKGITQVYLHLSLMETFAVIRYEKGQKLYI